MVAMVVVTALIVWAVVTSPPEPSVMIGDEYSMFVTPEGGGHPHWESRRGSVTIRRYLPLKGRDTSRVEISRGDDAVMGHFQISYNDEVMMMTCEVIPSYSPKLASLTYLIDRQTSENTFYHSNESSSVIIVNRNNVITKIILPNEDGADRSFNVGFHTNFVLDQRDKKIIEFVRKNLQHAGRRFCELHKRQIPHSFDSPTLTSMVEVSQAASTRGATDSVLLYSNTLTGQFAIFDAAESYKHKIYVGGVLSDVMCTVEADSEVDLFLFAVEFFSFNDDSAWETFVSTIPNVKSVCVPTGTSDTALAILSPLFMRINASLSETSESITVRGTECSLWHAVEDSYEMHVYFPHDRTGDDWPLFMDIPQTVAVVGGEPEPGFFTNFMGPHTIHRSALSNSLVRVQLPQLCEPSCEQVVCADGSSLPVASVKTVILLSSVVFVSTAVITYFVLVCLSMVWPPDRSTSRQGREVDMCKVITSSTSSPPKLPIPSSLQDLSCGSSISNNNSRNQLNHTSSF